MNSYTNYYRQDDCSLADFASLLTQKQGTTHTRYAANVEKEIPIYDCARIGSILDSERWQLLSEWQRILAQGSGVFVLRKAYSDNVMLDKVTQIFHEIIEKEKTYSGGDHFAKAGANDRIWNAHQKFCQHDPLLFAHYYGNEIIDAACTSWLGPDYQMTAQVNLVRPGGKAQKVHRDYHLGFQTNERAQLFPAQVHHLSQYLTLQGAVIHCDMPLASGPTKVLPYSQLYAPGYLAWRREEFSDYFDQHGVQLDMYKGDALFFNPALFHAAGENHTADNLRLANLLQVSSAFGRAMESLDRLSMCAKLYPALQKIQRNKTLTSKQIDCAIHCCAEGYPFPTSLDKDQPLDGLVPPSQAALFQQALQQGWSVKAFLRALHEQAEKRKNTVPV